MDDYALNILKKELRELEEKKVSLGAKRIGEQHQGFNVFSDIYRVMTDLEENIRSIRIAIRDME